MPTFSAWAGGEGQPDAIAMVIAEKPTTTGTITRGSGTVSTKAGRLETESGQKQIQGQGGIVYSIDAYFLSILGTDLRPGDRFTINSQAFEVIGKMPGHIDCEQYWLTLRA
jgi:hypothetical protein